MSRIKSKEEYQQPSYIKNIPEDIIRHLALNIFFIKFSLTYTDDSRENREVEVTSFIPLYLFHPQRFRHLLPI